MKKAKGNIKVQITAKAKDGSGKGALINLKIVETKDKKDKLKN